MQDSKCKTVSDCASLSVSDVNEYKGYGCINGTCYVFDDDTCDRQVGQCTNSRGPCALGNTTNKFKCGYEHYIKDAEPYNIYKTVKADSSTIGCLELKNGENYLNMLRQIKYDVIVGEDYGLSRVNIASCSPSDAACYYISSSVCCQSDVGPVMLVHRKLSAAKPAIVDVLDAAYYNNDAACDQKNTRAFELSCIAANAVQDMSLLIGDSLKETYFYGPTKRKGYSLEQDRVDTEKEVIQRVIDTSKDSVLTINKRLVDLNPKKDSDVIFSMAAMYNIVSIQYRIIIKNKRTKDIFAKKISKFIFVIFRINNKCI
ncbi:MAG: hypothetical protein EOO61_16165 [Hymenobacter sp.]|nr:MAG: hypothetical protein EOO61_16165 [Hymenobacter sp.]